MAAQRLEDLPAVRRVLLDLAAVLLAACAGAPAAATPAGLFRRRTPPGGEPDHLLRSSPR